MQHYIQDFCYLRSTSGTQSVFFSSIIHPCLTHLLLHIDPNQLERILFWRVLLPPKSASAY